MNACELAKERGISTLGITNTAHSSLTRISDATVYLKAGKEKGVASTKAFMAQLLVFLQIGWHIKPELYTDSLQESIKGLPNILRTQLKESSNIKLIAEQFKDVNHFLFVGRGIDYPLAMEGALKLKELSYVHAESYQMAELKHGPLALIDENFPVFLLSSLPADEERNLSTALEVTSRKGKIISLTTSNAMEMEELSEHIIYTPFVDSTFVSILNCIPMQLFAYHMALVKDRNVDQPRNLAKSVTVE